MDDTLITPAECAALRGVSRQAVNAAIQRNALSAVKVGRHYAIKRSDCEMWEPMEARQESGRKSAKRRKEKPE